MATSRLKIIVYYCGPHIVLFGVNFGVFVCDFEDNNIMLINFVGSDKDIFHSYNHFVDRREKIYSVPAYA